MAMRKLVGVAIAGVAYGAHCPTREDLWESSGHQGGRSIASGTLLESSRLYTNPTQLFSAVQARLDRSAGNLGSHGAKINKH